MRCFGKKSQSFLCKVVLLDEQELIQEIQDTTPGQEVLDTVFRHLNLLETAYFGLRYLDASNQPHWLDPTKKVAKQLRGTDPFTLYFGVKFYAADPCKLLEEITRYQFFLQVKQDILQARLPVTFDLAAELGSYVVQSELGDYDPRRHSPGYVSEFRFIANQTVELESRIAELHKGLVGQIPAVAELNYLEKVKWLDMYGVDLHPVLGEDNVEYFLGLTPSGIIVLRNKTKVGNYFWPRITKVYFKGRYFMLRVCDKTNDENTYGFETPSKQACKHLWRCCVEHHAFFRLVQVTPPSSDTLFSLGSRFRYSGRTEKQAQRDAQMRLRSPPQFSRTPSRRYQRRVVEGAQDSPKVIEEGGGKCEIQETKIISVPQPVSTPGIHRSTSIPAALPRADSPRSTRSAPWTQPRGLYSGAASPRSVRSAGHRPVPPNNTTSRLNRRSGSVESQSSVDSRACKRHRHRSRRGSDNESEFSKCSGRSHGHHRHRSHKRDSGSENDHHHHRHRHRSGRHRHGSHYELVDSEAQWREVQRKQAEGRAGAVQIHQATVVRDLGQRRSGYVNSGMETESEHAYHHHKRKHRKHRSRSRSPSEGKAKLPEELKRHLEFDLIDTEGMSADQLREIAYTVVETNSKPVKVKFSPNTKRRQRSPRRANSSAEQSERCQPPDSGDSPPPPYSPPQNGTANVPNGGSSSGVESRGSPSVTFSPDTLGGEGGNNNAFSSKHVSSHNIARNSASFDFSSPSRTPSTHYAGSDVGAAATSYSSNPYGRPTFSSAIYSNAASLLGLPNGHVQLHNSGATSLQSHLPQSSSGHEHSDSGLGAESQDYGYHSSRTNESAKYAQTTKLSTNFAKPSGSASKALPATSHLNMLRAQAASSPSFLPGPGQFLPHVTLSGDKQLQQQQRPRLSTPPRPDELRLDPCSLPWIPSPQHQPHSNGWAHRPKVGGWNQVAPIMRGPLENPPSRPGSVRSVRSTPAGGWVSHQSSPKHDSIRSHHHHQTTAETSLASDWGSGEQRDSSAPPQPSDGSTAATPASGTPSSLSPDTPTCVSTATTGTPISTAPESAHEMSTEL